MRSKLIVPTAKAGTEAPGKTWKPGTRRSMALTGRICCRPTSRPAGKLCSSCRAIRPVCATYGVTRRIAISGRRGGRPLKDSLGQSGWTFTTPGLKVLARACEWSGERDAHEDRRAGGEQQDPLAALRTP